jgi:hypothetical protein
VRYVLLRRVIGGIVWNLGLKRTRRELHKAKEELDDSAGDEGDHASAPGCGQFELLRSRGNLT